MTKQFATIALALFLAACAAPQQGPNVGHIAPCKCTKECVKHCDDCKQCKCACHEQADDMKPCHRPAK